MLTLTNIVDAIWRVEGGEHTRHTYGIMQKYEHTTPRQACLNTVIHASKDFQRKYHYFAIDRCFVTFLANRYCPESADPIGNKNWKVNMIKILHL